MCLLPAPGLNISIVDEDSPPGESQTVRVRSNPEHLCACLSVHTCVCLMSNTRTSSRVHPQV